MCVQVKDDITKTSRVNYSGTINQRVKLIIKVSHRVTTRKLNPFCFQRDITYSHQNSISKRSRHVREITLLPRPIW